jgi:hypothetical protein
MGRQQFVWHGVTEETEVLYVVENKGLDDFVVFWYQFGGGISFN